MNNLEQEMLVQFNLYETFICDYITKELFFFLKLHFHHDNSLIIHFHCTTPPFPTPCVFPCVLLLQN